MGTDFSFKVPIKLEDGFLGRECPKKDCLGYFKVGMGTGLTGTSTCHCPYCGHAGHHRTFWTPEQLAYIRSVAMNTIQGVIRESVKNSKYIRFEGRRHPIRHYREKALETEVVCDNCTLRYAIYGLFAYCPDCGVHNSLQILNKNLALYDKLLVATEGMEAEVAEHLVGNALEDAVSAFDGFGRETCRVRGLDSISFQGIARARTRVQTHFNVDMAACVTPDEWEFVCRCFQKRHVIGHRSGVVDQEYIDATNDRAAVVGRKVSVKREEVANLISLLSKVGEHLVTQLPPP